MAWTGWKDFHGTYQRSGAPYNVALVGSPSGTGKYGVNLGTAHNSGYGYGIRFSNNQYKVTTQLNLIACAIQDNRSWVSTSPYYSPYGGTYDYTLTIQISKDGGKTYPTMVFQRQIFSHNGYYGNSDAMYPNGTWATTARKSQWQGDFNVPVGTTHVRFTLTAENPMDVEPVIFPITDIITDFMPWAIRENGQWKSLDNPGYKFQIRQNGRWVTASKYSDAGKENTGSSRIRHDGKWYSQSKVGN